ncbi:hypothetical protein BDN72DRAFT_962261 [Pluteus cervinus]|uniref:Uncharacterized protein n=1 Tax=Pluteus cervinus TaxID=181527 RepID=A0ACD3AK49_9AGAR|nr:hypothetical protein BDN72DRAFT_962261 [Pluteus cervinus]
MAALPPELMQEIISAYVEGRSTLAASIATVSRDFNDWVKPVLSKTLMYYHEEPAKHWPVPVHELPQWLRNNGKYVRNVMWGIDVKDLLDVFNQCPGITDLAVWVNVSWNDLTTLLPSLSNIQLSNLSINLYNLCGRRNFSKQEAERAVFRTITHLELFHNIKSWDDFEGIAYLPRLTHLCLPEGMSTPSSHDDISRVLQHCKQLKVLVIIAGGLFPSSGQNRVIQSDTLFNSDEDDPRVVALARDCLDDWVYGATGRKDMWALADEIVERRLIDRRYKENTNDV